MDQDASRTPRLELPDITPLQFLVLALLARFPELPGRELRVLLDDNGVKSSGPQFYQLMARMEASGQVVGWYAQKEIEHQVVNERRYRITEAGAASWKNACDFYSAHSPASLSPAPSASRPPKRLAGRRKDMIDV